MVIDIFNDRFLGVLLDVLVLHVFDGTVKVVVSNFIVFGVISVVLS